MVLSLSYILVGLFAGTVSGIIGIGGGVVIIPILVYLFKFSQHTAQGTTLALLIPPIGIFAAWMYYKSGYVNIPVAILICLGFVLGGFFGAKIAVWLPELVLKRVFGFTLLALALYMITSK